MDDNKKKNIELNIAISITVILLLAVTFTFMKNNSPHEKPPIPDKAVGPELEKEKPAVLRPQFAEPEGALQETSRDDIKSAEKKAEPAEEKPEIMSLKDLPLDSIQSDQKTSQAEEAAAVPQSNVQPSSEDIRKLQQKGLIIY